MTTLYQDSELNETDPVRIIEKIQSEEFEKEWATAINDKVNLPLLNEEQEQKVFEELFYYFPHLFHSGSLSFLQKQRYSLGTAAVTPCVRDTISNGFIQ